MTSDHAEARWYCEPCRAARAEPCGRHVAEPQIDLRDPFVADWLERSVRERLDRLASRCGSVAALMAWAAWVAVFVGSGYLVKSRSIDPALAGYSLGFGLFVLIIGTQPLGIHPARWFVQRVLGEPFLWSHDAGQYAETLLGSLARQGRVILSGFGRMRVPDTDSDRDIPPERLLLLVAKGTDHRHSSPATGLVERLAHAAMIHPSLERILPTYAKNGLYFSLDFYLAWHEARRTGRPLPVASPPEVEAAPAEAG